MNELSMQTIVGMCAMMLGSLAVGCGGAGDVEEGDVHAEAWLETGAARTAEACEAIRIDTWFGPTRTSIEARASCESILAQECAALGCAADPATIDVHGYGSGTDTNYYCQGTVEQAGDGLPAYLAGCKGVASPVEGPASDDSESADARCGERFPPCPSGTECMTSSRGAFGVCAVVEVRDESGRP